jgi:predicted amidophosphoribosyltransferase
MRDRHFPRLCRTCDAPMARQENTCWHCRAQWVDKPETTSDSAGTDRAADDTQAPVLVGAGS